MIDEHIDAAAQRYINAIEPAHRPLFDRIHGLILAAYPDAEVVISYQIPAYKVGKRRLYVGVWRHGVSLYGWSDGGDGGFTDRHPELKTSKGTIRLRASDAATITDDELSALITSVLHP